MFLYTLFLIILIILIILILFCINDKTNEKFENINIDIGNTLCDYYFKYFISILDKKDFISDTKSTYNGKYVEKKYEFIESLPKKIIFNEEINNKLIETNINFEYYKNVPSLDFWGIHSLEKHKIHSIMKPYMNIIFNDSFTKLGLNTVGKVPIIHFRCADTPFIKISNYHFQKYDFFKDALKKYDFSPLPPTRHHGLWPYLPSYYCEALRSFHLIRKTSQSFRHHT